MLRVYRETEGFDNSAPNPFKKLMKQFILINLNFHVCNVIDRSDGQVKLFDLRSTIYSQIVDYARIQNTVILPIQKLAATLRLKKKTGPLPQNANTPAFLQGYVAPSKEEQALDLFDLNRIYKRQSYDEQKSG